MAGEFLDEADVGSALQEVGRAGVAQEVRPAIDDVGRADVFAVQAVKGVWVEAFAVAGEEDGLRFGVECELRAHFIEILFQPV